MLINYRFVKKYGCSRLAFLHFDHKTKGTDVQKTLLGEVGKIVP